MTEPKANWIHPQLENYSSLEKFYFGDQIKLNVIVYPSKDVFEYKVSLQYNGIDFYTVESPRYYNKEIEAQVEAEKHVEEIFGRFKI